MCIKKQMQRKNVYIFGKTLKIIHLDCCFMRISVYVDESASFQIAVVAFSHDTIHPKMGMQNSEEVESQPSLFNMMCIDN